MRGREEPEWERKLLITALAEIELKTEDRERGGSVYEGKKKGWLSEEFLWDGGAGSQHMFGHCFDNNASAKSNHDEIYELYLFGYVSWFRKFASSALCAVIQSTFIISKKEIVQKLDEMDTMKHLHSVLLSSPTALQDMLYFVTLTLFGLLKWINPSLGPL